MANQGIPDDVKGGDTKQSYSYVSMAANCLPKRLWISVVPDLDQPMTGTSLIGVTDVDEKLTFRPRTFARIDRCTLTIGSHSCLVGSDKEFLYQISARNGLTKKQEEAMYLSGHPLIIDLRKDCSLGGEIIGASQHTNIGIDLDFTNLCNDAGKTMKFKLFVIGEFDAVLQHNNANFSLNYTNIASSLTNTSIQDIASLSSNYMIQSGIYLGGSLWGKIKSGFNWVVDRAPAIYRGVKNGIDMYKTVRGGETRVIGGKSVIDERFA